jgi:thioredoxin reductase (NADPH)
VLEEVLGDSDPLGVTGVKLRNIKTDTVSDLDVDGVFVAIGHTPNTELFKGVIDMDDGGYLLTKPDSTGTNIDGVFASGDVQDHTYRQAVTAAGTGCMAALEADRFLAASGL